MRKDGFSAEWLRHSPFRRMLQCGQGKPVPELSLAARTAWSGFSTRAKINGDLFFREWGHCSPNHKKRAFDNATTASIHQLHQLLILDIPIRLRRVESAFSAPEGFEVGGGFELPGTADEDAVGCGCALEIVEEDFFFHAGLCLPFFAKGEWFS